MSGSTHTHKQQQAHLPVSSLFSVALVFAGKYWRLGRGSVKGSGMGVLTTKCSNAAPRLLLHQTVLLQLLNQRRELKW